MPPNGLQGLFYFLTVESYETLQNPQKAIRIVQDRTRIGRRFEVNEARCLAMAWPVPSRRARVVQRVERLGYTETAIRYSQGKRYFCIQVRSLERFPNSRAEIANSLTEDPRQDTLHINCETALAHHLLQPSGRSRLSALKLKGRFPRTPSTSRVHLPLVRGRIVRRRGRPCPSFGGASGSHADIATSGDHLHSA